MQIENPFHFYLNILGDSYISGSEVLARWFVGAENHSQFEGEVASALSIHVSGHETI